MSFGYLLVVLSRALDFSGQIWCILCSWQLIVVLRWTSTTSSFSTPGISANKALVRVCFYPFLDVLRLSLLPPAHREGEGRRKDGRSSASFGG
jgi:hypothetical protein